MDLDASRCPKCAETWIPPRERCPACASVVAPARVPDEGVILSWTVVHVAPSGHAAGSAVALVALGDAVALASGEPGAPLQVGAQVRVRAAGTRLTFTRR